ncbi:MAG TPA: monovalent cation/H(+) antiporter subunit G [Bryobacteraceae bacterium]|nr:monovalent cation/H(+) antiporter subunit G [Bryobacteraceae bacterium]
MASVLVLLGASLVLLAAIGVVRMPDVFTRMQAATKAATLGLGCLLAGGAIELGDFATLIRAVSIGAFVMLTSPVSTHVIARAAYLTRVPLWKGTLVDEWREDAGGERPEQPRP